MLKYYFMALQFLVTPPHNYCSEKSLKVTHRTSDKKKETLHDFQKVAKSGVPCIHILDIPVSKET